MRYLSIEVIKDIKSTEQIAENKIKDAQVKAKEIIKKSEYEAERIIKEAIDKSTKEGKALIQQAAESAQKEADNRLEISKKENEKLKIYIKKLASAGFFHLFVILMKKYLTNFANV